jgi:hypothetical protein
MSVCGILAASWCENLGVDRVPAVRASFLLKRIEDVGGGDESVVFSCLFCGLVSAYPCPLPGVSTASVCTPPQHPDVLKHGERAYSAAVDV